MGAPTEGQFAPLQQQLQHFGGEEEPSITAWRASLHGAGGSSGDGGNESQRSFSGCLQPSAGPAVFTLQR